MKAIAIRSCDRCPRHGIVRSITTDVDCYDFWGCLDTREEFTYRHLPGSNCPLPDIPERDSGGAFDEESIIQFLKHLKDWRICNDIPVV